MNLPPLDIMDGFAYEPGGENKIDVILEKLEKYCVGDTNEIYERYNFNGRS